MDYPVKMPVMPTSKKELKAIEKEITKPKSKPKPKVLKGEAAIDAYQKSISPEGMAKANADAKKAIEKKYPGMFIPETRTSTRINRGN